MFWRKNQCNREDIHFLYAFFLGVPEPSKSDFKRHLGKSFFGVMQSLVGGPTFSERVVAAAIADAPLPQDLWTPRDINHIQKGLKRHLKLTDTLIEQALSEPLGLFILGMKQPRVQKALSQKFSADRLRHFTLSLDALTRLQSDTLHARVEAIIGFRFHGYALNKADTDTPLVLDIYVGPAFVGQCVANKMRRDLQDIYGGSGLYGFDAEFSIPPVLVGGRAVYLEIRDHATGARLDRPHEITAARFDELGPLQQIADNLNWFRQEYEKGREGLTEEMGKMLTGMTDFMPNLAQMQIFPVENYALARSVYKPALAPTDPPASVGFAPFGTPIGNDTAADWVIWQAPGDQWHHDIGRFIAAALKKNPNARIVGFNFDWDGRDPVLLGPGFDIDFFLAKNQMDRAFAVRCDMVEAGDDGTAASAMVLRCYSQHGTDAIALVPHIVAQLDSRTHLSPDQHIDAVSAYVTAKTGENAQLTRHRDRLGGPVLNALSITWPAPPHRKRDIIIPTRNALDLSRGCVESLEATLSDRNAATIIIVNNGSDDPAMLDWLASLRNRGGYKIIDDDRPFNWSALNNRAVQESDGDELLFLNNDTRAIDRGWDQRLSAQLARPDIGIVGARLLYEDGTLQHAGVVLYDIGVATHEAAGESPAEGLYLDRSRLPHRCAAVTGAFLGCRRADFEKVGGFDADNLTVSFNDIDFCLKMGVEGLACLYDPDISFFHYESKTRGYDFQDSAKAERAARERAVMEERWGPVLSKDPYYPAQFTRIGKAFSALQIKQ